MHIYLLPPANEVWGKVIFSVACVKNSVHRGVGVCLSACWDTTSPAGTPLGADTPPPPRTRHPLGADTPPGPGNPPATRHSPAQCMLSYTVNERAVCILLECNLVNTIFQQCCLGLMLVDGFQTDSKACTQCESPLVVIVTICLFICRYRVSIFVLTFFAYTTYHLSRKPISVVKVTGAGGRGRLKTTFTENTIFFVNFVNHTAG